MKETVFIMEKPEAITKKYATSFYWASKVLPAEKRKAAHAIYAFCRVSDDIADNKMNISEMGEWRQKTQKAIMEGESKNEILNEFIKTINKFGIEKNLPLQLIEGLEKDMQKERYADYSELDSYCYDVASIPGLMMLPVFADDKGKAREGAIKLGKAMQLTNILRDIKEDYENGKIYIPLEDLNRFNYKEINFENGIINENLKELIDFEIKRAETLYKESEAGLKFVSWDSKLCVALCKIFYQEILYEIKKSNYAVFKKRVFVPNWKKILLIGKTPLLLFR